MNEPSQLEAELMAYQPPTRPSIVEVPTVEINVREMMKVPWWHRFMWCAWTLWSLPFSSTSGGLIAAFAGSTAGPWWQGRECLVCGKAQRRRVEVPGDRTDRK